MKLVEEAKAVKNVACAQEQWQCLLIFLSGDCKLFEPNKTGSGETRNKIQKYLYILTCGTYMA